MVLVVRQPGVLPEPDAFAQLQQMGVTVERPQVVMTADDGMRLVLENAARLERRSEGEVALRTETGEQRPLATERKLKVEVPNGRQFRLVLDDGSEVWLTCPDVVTTSTAASGVAVRYAFLLYPMTNLENGAGLPAEPFRTDSWSAEISYVY